MARILALERLFADGDPKLADAGGRRAAAGRSQEEDLPPAALAAPGERAGQAGHHTSVWELAPGRRANRPVTVPGAGDCSCCGQALDPDGDLAMSYHSQHERQPLPAGLPAPADVFLARIRL